MRHWAALFSFVLVLLGTAYHAQAQVVTAGPDSVVVATPATVAIDTTQKKGFKNWSRPAKAAFYSLVVPGLGQAYNKSYWKIPLIYATGAVIGYFIYDNNRQYQGFSKAIRVRFDGDPNTIDQYANQGLYAQGLPNDQGDRNLQRSRDFFRKYRDLDIILGVLAWGLNVMEAHVHAHLKGFDVGDDLSFRLTPGMQQVAHSSSYAAGLTLQINLNR
ncbi:MULTISPECIES: DUF5683 domain-containing protein [Rufibacter]|uniref:DUF5683 domain-containing protein n=1 Tax=Rufibacter quisquiliarum TaxID=1549639 RepID=A0A839GWC5_9BACT|nr:MULTISPECIES: DUF5683 domain-containing protein [Rufibacter]MBA9078051.1 hypothetical protein [Rufibacter quisquiliarum]